MTSVETKDNLLRRLIAILLQCCPSCLHGLVGMHETCPQCGYQFGREPGYFTGAMFASFALAVPILFIIFMVLWNFFSDIWPLTFNLFVTFIVFLPFVPLIFRFSRVIWMHIDWLLDPEKAARG